MIEKYTIEEWIEALEFAAGAHDEINQRRRGSGLPYIVHPVTIAKIVEMNSTKDTIMIQIAALMHDVVEDTNRTIREIIKRFGHGVGNLVKEMTDDPELLAKMTKVEYHKNKMLHMTDDALYLKLCDRLGNVSDLPKEKYLRDTVKVMDFLVAERHLDEDQTQVLNKILDICFIYKQINREDFISIEDDK